MKYEYLAQEEYDVLDKVDQDDGKKMKDPVEITIKITVEKTRYESVKNRRKTYLPDYIKDIFKPSK